LTLYSAGEEFGCYILSNESRETYTVLVNETNKRTEFQFYWYYDSTCFGQPFCPSSGVLGRTSALVHFADLITLCCQEQDGTAVPSCSWQQAVIKSGKCTNADVRLRTPNDGQKGCPKHVES